ncbi:MAG: hypothetical protein AB1640_21985 [bacterium]
MESDETASKCRYHPDEPAVAVCRKFGYGYCARCCGLEGGEARCACTSPRVHCESRQACIVHHLRRKKKIGPRVV